MFNTNQMDQRRDEYLQRRQKLAEREQLACIAQSQRPTFGLRPLAIAIRLWQQRPHFITRQVQSTEAFPDTITTSALQDVG